MPLWQSVAGWRWLHDAVTQTFFSASLIAEVLPQIWSKTRRRPAAPGRFCASPPAAAWRKCAPCCSSCARLPRCRLKPANYSNTW